MSRTMPHATYSRQMKSDALQDQFGRKLAARLSEASAEVPHDISERLRVARGQALAQRKKLKPALALAGGVSLSGGAAALHFGDERISLWNRFAAMLPLVLLVVGLITINIVQDDSRTNELAEVDSALLTDDLPPAAYVDPGFAQFLKTSNDKTP